MEILSKRLKELRTERGLTQKQLANTLGLAQSSIKNAERASADNPFKIFRSYNRLLVRRTKLTKSHFTHKI